MTQVVNFLRYPGSKRRVLSFLGQYIPTSDLLTGKYVEPFVGGGAVFFYINPRNAILSDLNHELIDLYIGIQDDPEQVWDIYSKFGANKMDYNCIREENNSSDKYYKAARVLYLNRTCFKGMWRHNLQGNFNVGYGGEARRWVINVENLIELSNSLRNAQISCNDFEATIEKCLDGDFLFLDPPYKPGEREQNNQHYCAKEFKFEDHIRLADCLHKSTKGYVHWALTTSSHHDITSLFKGCWAIQFPFGTGTKPGVMNQNPGEILITNYEIKGGIIL